MFVRKGLRAPNYFPSSSVVAKKIHHSLLLIFPVFEIFCRFPFFYVDCKFVLTFLFQLNILKNKQINLLRFNDISGEGVSVKI